MQNNFYDINKEVDFKHILNGNTHESLVRKGRITGIKEGYHEELYEITFDNGEITFLSKRKLEILRFGKI
jgi:hypothetical protein